MPQKLSTNAIFMPRRSFFLSVIPFCHPRRLSPTFSIGDLIEDPVLLPLSLPSHPRSPKMNAHAERFNRTLQEQFVDYQEDLLFDDLAAFNQKLADWLLAYNTVLPHHSPD